MFYSQFILAKKGPLGTIWLAAHLERKLRKNQIADTDIGISVDSILFPDVPIALRLSSHLLLGVARIYSRKVNYLFDDCSEALLKVKQAFRSTAVDLPPEESKAPYHSITLPETFELDDFELPENDIFQGNYVDHHVSSREQITLQDTMDGVAYSTSKFGLDERFGDGDTSGLDLDEELFLENVAAAGEASVRADPQASVEPMTPLKQDEHHEGMAANSESMIDGVDEDADFMDYAQAPCTPGLVEEPNLSNIQETSACEDHIELEDHHLTEISVKENSKNISGECDANDESKLLENLSVTGASNFDTVHCVAPEENGYHLSDRYYEELGPDGQSPSGVVMDPLPSDDPALASGLSSIAVDQFNAKPSTLECGDEIVPSNPTSPKTTFLNNVEIPGYLDKSWPPSNLMKLAAESPDRTCLENSKTDACEEANICNEETTHAQMPVLRACNTDQLVASNSRCDHLIHHDLISDFYGFHAQETSREEASHALGTCTAVQGEMCHVTCDSELISEGNLMKGPASYKDIQADFEKLNGQVDNVFSEPCAMENLSSSPVSDFPAPEKLLSVPAGLVDLPRNTFPEATPGDMVGIDETDAGSKFISGKKRSYTESTLTEQSLNSAESSRMVRSKRTTEFIPDDDDLLSSILVGRRSSALKLKPTPPPSEITSSKRPGYASRMSANKRKVLMDDTMVLHGDMIRQQLTDTEDIRRVRKKAPCTHAEISVIQKQLLEDEIFCEPILTGVLMELASLHKRTFDVSTVKVSPSDVSCSHIETDMEPQLNSEYAENSTSNLDKQHTAMFNEPHVIRENEKQGNDECFETRDNSELKDVETIVLTDNKEVDDHEPSLNDNSSRLQPDIISGVAEVNGSDLGLLDDAAKIETEETCTSEAEAAGATDTASVAEVVLSCPDDDKSGDLGYVPAAFPLTDSFDESKRDDTSILTDVSCASHYCTPATQVNVAVADLCSENLEHASDLTEKNNRLTSEVEVGTEHRVGDTVLVEAIQCSAAVDSATDLENNVVESENQSLANNGMDTEQPFIDASYSEAVNAPTLDHSGGYPCQQECYSFNMVGGPVSDVHLGDLNDLDYSAAGNDTGFLNFDEEEEVEAADDYVPDADVTRITENSGWSSRTRAVSKYLQNLFIKESECGGKALSMDSLLVGKTRKEASRMFFEALVLKTRDYIHVEQVIPFDDVAIEPQMKLMKSDF